MANKNQKLIMDVLTTRPILFNPDIARVLGSVKAGLFLSQLLYWSDKGINPDWIYKTIEEIERETSLKRSEQDTAIKICKTKDVIEVKLMGIPAKRNFKINKEKIIELLKKYYASLSETDKLVCRKIANLVANKKQRNTDNTSYIYNIDSVLQTGQIIDLPDLSFKNKKPKPFYRNMQIVTKKDGKRYCKTTDGSPWLEFDERAKNDIEWR